MATLADLVTSRMTPEVMQKLAGLAGVSSTSAKRAIDAIIPTQLDNLVSMGATEAGANRLLSLLKEHKGTESFAHVLLAGDAMQSQGKAGPCSRLSMAMIQPPHWRRTLAPGRSSKTPSISPGRGCAGRTNYGERVWIGRDGSTAVSSCPEV
jgi:hypothetical protein